MKNGRKATMKQMLASYRRSPSSLMLRILVILAAATTAFVLLTIIGYIVMRGIPHINAGLFAWEYTTENVSMMPAVINTITMTALALALAVPIGIFSAIYLVEYARRGNRLVSLVRITAETLSGIPSIVYGLFGFLLFAISLGWGLTFLGGALTLAVMILPLVMRTTEEALIAVPDMYREGSFGLGAGKLRTVFQIVLPAAIPGILAGVILSIGRIVGETAALIFSAGTIAGVPSSLMDSGRTLSVHMYALLSEGLYMDEAYATAVVLLLLVVVINTLSAVVARAFSRR
ncbi:MAG: phosphate ABC transporter permease PstA [Bacillota bacterium]|jgi:phosphate transport system permease protein|nr:phosphate ABC transporter permease PstA [Bacillota bacterium]NLV69534.1 phosphate ABC transporter permease PstA [Clostridiales bacterium]